MCKNDRRAYMALALGAICLTLFSCQSNISKQSFADFDPKLISYELPEDVDSTASEQDLATFAWREFFALNWASSWNKDQRRTTPDTLWDFASSGAQPDLAVWETYIHRSELRPASGQRTEDLSKGSPHYSFVDSTMIITDTVHLSNYWNVLDEDNEIGSSYLFSHQNESEVLYMAKTNLVEYNYLKNYFPTDPQLNAAADQITSLSPTQRLSHFLSYSKAAMCASDSLSKKGLICLPCGDKAKKDPGVLEIKLAFRELNPLHDSIERFITKKVVVFKPVGTSQNLQAAVHLFGLIGMHIIHKTQNYPAFIFASWEQVDVRNNNMQTIGLDSVKVDGTKYGNVDPHRSNPVIERVIPEGVQQVNQSVKKAIQSKNASSKWQYYQLIGVQGIPFDYTNRNGNNNYFMANYAIESDLKLTNFHGSFPDPFNASINNVVFNKNAVNMGGCQGCHGQAQGSFGTDFSFLLDSGNNKPVIIPDPYQTYQQALIAAGDTIGKSQVKAFQKLMRLKRKS